MGETTAAIILQRAKTRIDTRNVAEGAAYDGATGYVFDQVIPLAGHGAGTIILQSS